MVRGKSLGILKSLQKALKSMLQYILKPEIPCVDTGKGCCIFTAYFFDTFLSYLKARLMDDLIINY